MILYAYYLKAAEPAIGVFARGDWKKKRIIEQPQENDELMRLVNKETLVEEGIK